jgi:predicted O-methyltransferase YrrM
MSEESTLVTREHFRYLAERTAGDDDFLKSLKQAAKDEGIPTIWVAPEQASFMQILLKLCGARQVVPKHADFAERWVARSDVAGKVEVHRGAGMDVLPRFATGSADAAFLDADKPSYPDYLRECLRIVRAGGLIMADNAFAFGELFAAKPTQESVDAVRRFNEVMARERALHSIVVPIGDGLWVGVKR